MDLVIEPQGDTIMVGHYCEMNGDLVSDPVLVFLNRRDYIHDLYDWLPWSIEQVFGGTIIRYYDENGKLMFYSRHEKDFIYFSAMFASNLIHQGWKKAKTKRF